MPLDIRTAAIEVQTAVVNSLALAYGQRRADVATLSDLATIAIDNLLDHALAFVQAEGVAYRLHKAAVDPEVLPYVVKPAGVTNGRWKQAFTTMTLGPNYERPLHRIQSGYARIVEEWKGQSDEAIERIFANSPAFLVELVEDVYELSGTRHGGIYKVAWHFVIHCFARNLRRGPDALIGSEVSEDSGLDSDPGVLRMLGDARYLLAGTDLGLGLSVMFCAIDGSGRVAESDYDQRQFRGELDLIVRGTVHRVDEDLISGAEIWAERFETGGHPFDPRNAVLAGLMVIPEEGVIAASPIQGVAMIDGDMVACVPGLYQFEPNSETYRDLNKQGVLTYYRVDVGQPAPPQEAGTLRIGVTLTDDSQIVADKFLASYRISSSFVTGDPFKAAP